MAETFRLSMAQLNATMGDLDANARMIRDAWARAKEAGADFLVLPEMFITGNPAQDLARKAAFLADAQRVIDDLARALADGPAVGLGGPWQSEGRVFDAFHILQGGKVVARIPRHEFPAPEAADELRVFASGPIHGPYRIGPARIGSPIGADAEAAGVAETLAETGAEILIVPASSPYHRGAQDRRMAHSVARVVENGLPLVWLNLVGGQDDLVFDGASFVLNPGDNGGATKVVQLAPFEERLVHVDFSRTAQGWRALPGVMEDQPDEWEQDYHAITLALRDYMRKSGFTKAVLGMSGGIDSALVATIAADAIGPENVHCVMLPSEYTSPDSLEDAQDCTARLGARLDSVPIDGMRNAVAGALSPLMAGTKPDTTEENIQARLRALVLMAISNKFGELLLTTGNKSEIGVGYGTIYGDMAGGFNPIKDLYKTRVFETCRWRNSNHRDWMLGRKGEVIPPRIIEKPPSAELRPGQKDQDSLPAYEILDPILAGFLEQDCSVADLMAQGFDKQMVLKVQFLIYGNEWKRRQAAPGPRITDCALGVDRRYPLVNKWRDKA